MKHLICRNFAATLACAVALGHYSVQARQDCPNRTIRVVVPFAASGGGGEIGRVCAQKLSEAPNVPVILDNCLGASTRIGSDFVAKAEPDGDTRLLNVPLLVQTLHLYSKLPHHSLVNRERVATLANSPPWLALSTQMSSARTTKECLVQDKLHSKDHNHASAGAGSSGHLLV